MKSRLLGALLTGVNRAHPYLPSKDNGMEKHIDALYKIAHMSSPSVRTQALMLLFHLAVGSKSQPSQDDTISKTQASRKDRFYRALYSKVGDPIMLSAGRQLTLFFNLIYKAMKYDSNGPRVVAFGKRLLHVTLHSSPATISGALFLLSEVVKHQPLLHSSTFSASGHLATFCPLKREPSAAFTLTAKTAEKEDTEDANKVNENVSSDGASLWELSLTLHHYHPTVSKFSSSLTDIAYKGDPLRDFTLAPFLDKFAFRNPKTVKKTGNKSIGARWSGLEAQNLALMSLPVNDVGYWKNKGNQSSEREDFFQKFFAERTKRDELKGINRGENVSEETDALEDAENREVDLDWDTDEEEEQFVQNLAEKLMEGSAGAKVNFDDEDPDVEDWSDVEDDVEDSDNSVDDDSTKMESKEAQFAAFDGVAVGSDNDGSSEDENSEDDDMALQFISSDVSDNDEKDIVLFEENDAAGASTESAFADASEYDESITKALSEKSDLKRPLAPSDIDDEQNHSNKKRKKKRRKKAKTS